MSVSVLKHKSDWVVAELIDDSDNEIELDNNNCNDIETTELKTKEIKIKEIILDKNDTIVSKNPKPKSKAKPEPLKKYYNIELTKFEIGVDEAGRGPMFGRVYAGAVILPKDDTFEHILMKDSKKFGKSKKGQQDINNAAEYIKQNSLSWAVAYEDEQTIDEINILQATQSAMHKAIKMAINKLQTNQKEKEEKISSKDILLLIDGNYFKPCTMLNVEKTKMDIIRYEMIEQGDNTYTSIAAASILAKVERDKYIEELCLQNPELCEHYAINSNKGYGAKIHMEGIKKYGITKWHRKTFGICKEYC